MIQKSVILNFPGDVVEKPVLSRLIQTFNVTVNIIQAHIKPDEDGHMFLIFKASEAEMDKAMTYLHEMGVGIVYPDRNLIWHEDRCVHCGACVGQCLPRAFTVEEETRLVAYDTNKCIACELCIPACPFAAIESIRTYLNKKGEI